MRVTRKSDLAPESRMGWIDEQAKALVAEEMARYQAWMERRQAELKAEKMYRDKVSQGIAAFRELATERAGDLHEVIVLRAKETAMMATAHIGETVLPDSLDHLDRLSRDLGVKAGSLTMAEAKKWGHLAVHFTGKDGIKGQNMKRSVVIDVQTAMDRGPRKLGTVKVDTSPKMTRAEYSSALRSGNKVATALAVKAMRENRVIA